MHREVVLGLLLPWTFQYYLNEPLANSLADCMEIDKLLNGNGKGDEKFLALGSLFKPVGDMAKYLEELCVFWTW